MPLYRNRKRRFNKGKADRLMYLVKYLFPLYGAFAFIIFIMLA